MVKTRLPVCERRAAQPDQPLGAQRKVPGMASITTSAGPEPLRQARREESTQVIHKRKGSLAQGDANAMDLWDEHVQLIVIFN